MPLGTSSPTTTCRNVMIRNASSTATIVASHWSKNSASTRSPSAPMASEVSVTPSCIAAMKCGGSLVILTTERAVRLPSSASSFMRVRRTVTSEYSPATKKPFKRISATTAASSSATVIAGTPHRSWRIPAQKRCVRAPPHGRRYSAATRRPLRRGSIGDASAVLVPPRAALRDETLEVGQRLRDREPPRGGLQVVAEEGERDLVSGPRLVAERVCGGREALGMVGDQRARAAARVGDRLPVPGEGDAGFERDRPLERREVVAERVGTAPR